MFLEILGQAVTDARWRVHAYVLMCNHYHLLLETPQRTLSSGMKQLNERWANYFNWRYSRSGHLFQGRFDSGLVERERHLRELLRYIVLNPVRCGAAADAADEEWSSYRATVGIVPAPPWLEVDWTLAQFHEDRATAIEIFQTFVAAGKGVSLASAMAEPAGDEADSHYRCIEDLVVRALGVGREELRAKRGGMPRKLFTQLAREREGATFSAIAKWLGITKAAAIKLYATALSLERTDHDYAAAVRRARQS